MNTELERIQYGMHHDPFSYLGRHSLGDKEVVRAFMPTAETVEIPMIGKMSRIIGSDIFELYLDKIKAQKLPKHYILRWKEKENHSLHEIISSYSFLPQIKDFDLHLFSEGRHWHSWYFLGSHLKVIDGIAGSLFAVWAPAVKRISVIGDFNGWNGRRHPMRNRGQSGVWELFIPGLQAGDNYKYEILTNENLTITKCDPYGRAMTMRPDTTTLIAKQNTYQWKDKSWLQQRVDWKWQNAPVSIYEVHLGSWRRHSGGGFLNYRELANQLVPYVTNLGYTHIELLPIMEHPLDESWGYQVSAYFAPTSRFGNPDELYYFIDICHQNNIGVLLDWVPAHFPKDAFALAQFTGRSLYEYEDPRRGEHQDWGTLIFDYGRNEVRNFLISNALYWIEEFHIDGLRVDAVASMLYLNYSRGEGNWIPNKFGGCEHLEAIDFLRELNELVHCRFPGVMMIAEESTAWPMVSRPTYMGGLGFSMKWNMGWMHDTLTYAKSDPIYRKYHQDMLTFSQLYAWTENFVLPFSHDEVVHLKGSLLTKMPGDNWKKFANLRVLYVYQYMHPGKKLLFMGGEIAQWEEWSEKKSLDWELLKFPLHKGIYNLIHDLNYCYKKEPALYCNDFISKGFSWIDCHDNEQSILSFLRQGNNKKEVLVCVFNFTPVPREGYYIGVPNKGNYIEILNSDSYYYGGSNVGNNGSVKTLEQSWMGFSYSLKLILPPLAGIILKLLP